MTQKNQNSLSNITTLLRNPDLRWDGLVCLKKISFIEDLNEWHYYCKDSFWLVRWAIIEKLGDLQSVESLDVMFNALADTDHHVRKNAQKAIHKCVKSNITPILERFNSGTAIQQKFCQHYIKRFGLKQKMHIDIFLLSSPWLKANALLLFLFRTFGSQIESSLLKTLKHSFTQKHAIMMLGICASTAAIPYFITFYEQPPLRRHLIESLKQPSASPMYATLLEYIHHVTYSSTVQTMIIKIGEAIVPALLNSLSQSKSPALLIKCLKQIHVPKPLFQVVERTIATFQD